MKLEKVADQKKKEERKNKSKTWGWSRHWFGCHKCYKVTINAASHLLDCPMIKHRTAKSKHFHIKIS